MSSENLNEPRSKVLFPEPVLNQAMRYLIENGPLVKTPPLPDWSLSRLVAQKRILRLRSGLYLTARAGGELPDVWETAGLIAEEVSSGFWGALRLHGMTD